MSDRFPMLIQALRARRRALIGWVSGIVALIAITMLAYPSIQGQDSIEQLVEDYPDFVKELLGLGEGLQLSSGPGYLNSQLFSGLLPVLMLMLLIGFSGRTLATQEREGQLDLVLAMPTTRRRVYSEKAAAMLAQALLVGGAVAVAVLAMAPLVGMDDVGLRQVLGGTVSVVSLAVAFGSLAMMLAAMSGSRAMANGITAGIAGLMFVLWGLGSQVSWIEPLRQISLFFWAFAGTPILLGIQTGNVLVLLGAAAIFLLVGVTVFDRRDLRV